MRPARPGCCTEWGGVEHHGIAVLRQDRQRAHVRDQRVVAEAHAALGLEDVAVAGAGDLGEDIRHVPRRQELAFLDVDRPAGPPGGEQQIGLAAQEGRDLQHVHGLGGSGALFPGMDVGLSTGRPVAERTSSKIASALSRPMPRGLPILVRLALSKLVL